ncbi:DUF4189 domain-containing protein [uncultured Neisseria sp.]|uniref:DUF4189 domain-containing protein n=1 Tax=uncultured Neisseria sp. TaxID=237778 RepID=UPI0026254E97|nr:DUF4189 domain-containing protein [uncultured Neisseria sp.]
MKKLFLMVLGLISLNAYADPTYDATRGALQNNPALCGYGYNPNCSSGSSSAPPPKKIIYHDVKVPSKFGALAVSVKAGYIAGSLNHGSKEEAQREAVKRCRQGSRNTPCKAITWVRNGCLAAAKGKVKNNQFILSDAAGPQGTVEQTALQNCRNRGATECEIIMPEGCSLPQLQ